MTRRPLPPATVRASRGTPIADVITRIDDQLSHTLRSWLRRLDWRRARTEQLLLPEIAMQISRAVRSGRPLEHALIDAAALEHPALMRVSDQIVAGRSLHGAINDWAAVASSGAEQLLVAALSMGSESGTDLARALDLVGDGIRDDLQLDARRRTLLTQSRLSAAVLIALPLVFASIASLLQGRIIYQGASGFILLCVGVGLDLCGLAWIRRLLRGLT